MTNISLRAYLGEIESMIESGQFDEAIAHCRHILKTYPMHLDTYRLLGKAFLEARKYADASDIFQRVIMSVPDDFVSHVGMSIIRDDEGKLDQATWHMERAFEMQPSNPAIQDELRKLYGRRDGVEPSKVRLTRDALANMYTQGALYSQAIAEIRAVLANDPNRPDLQVMLVRAYSRDGRKSQAIELCTGLLRKYPYCFDALRTLLDLMTTTDRLDIIQSYRQRVFALDPYAAFVTGSVFDSNKVPDAAISLDKLSIVPQKDEVGTLPAWSSSLGIKLESDPNRATLPDSFPEEPPIEKPEVVESPPQELISSEEIIEGTDEIPDWMRSSGWEPSDGSSSEISQGEDQLPNNEEPAVKADIPDWLNGMAPTETDLPDDGKIANPDFELNKRIEINPGDDQPGLAESGFGEDPFSTGEIHGEVPEWLQEMGKLDTNLDDEALLSQTEGEQPEPGHDNVSEENHGETMSPADQAEFGTDFKESASQSDSIGNTNAESSSIDFQPDWLTEAEPEFLRDREIIAGPSSPEEKENETQADGSSMIAGQETTPSETTPGLDLPDWFEEVRFPSETEQPTLESSSPQSTGELDILADGISGLRPSAEISELEGFVPENLQPDHVNEDVAFENTTAETALPSPKEQDAAFNWLEGLAAKQGVNSEELLSQPEDRLEQPPEWVRGIINGEATPIEDLTTLIGSDEPSEPASFSAEQFTGDQLGVSDHKDELENLPVEFENIKDGEPVAQDTFEDSTTETELGSLEGYPPAEATIAEENNSKDQINSTPPQIEKESASEVSDWLKEMEEKEGITKSSNGLDRFDDHVPDSLDSLPDWLKEEAKGSVASEWIPETEDKIGNEEETGISGNFPLEQSSDEEQEAISPRSIESDSASETDNEPQLAHFGKPVTSNEWKPVEQVDLNVPSDPNLSNRMELIASGKLPGTGILSKIPGVNVEKESATLQKAQDFIEKDDLKNALQEYGRLIKKGQMLEQVIHDLREITYRYPVEISIWQMLGDAFMRGNRLQDALDAYTKAEELLR